MDKYENKIKTLTKSASQTPTLQMSGQSTLGDIAQGLSFGFEVFSKLKAKQDLENLEAKNEEYNKKFATNVMAYRTLRQELKNSGVGVLKAQEREEEFLRQLDPIQRMEVVSATNKLTKESSVELYEDIQKQQDDNLEKYTLGEAFASQIKGYNPEQAKNATDEQKLEWAKESEVFSKKLELQKQAYEIADNKTAEIVELNRMIFTQRLTQASIDLRELWRSGQSESAIAKGDEIRVTLTNLITGASKAIKEQMVNMGDGRYYDAKLVADYTKELQGMLDNDNFQKVLSGTETNSERKSAAINLMDSILSKEYYTLFNKVKSGEYSKEELDNFKKISEHFQNKDIDGAKFLDSGLSSAISSALGLNKAEVRGEEGKVSPQQQAGWFAGLINMGASWFKGSDKENIGLINKEIGEVNLAKIEAGDALTESDVEYLLEALSYGENGKISEKGKGASKAVLKDPLRIFAVDKDKFDVSIKPALSVLESQGIDPVNLLTKSLDNHLRNNFQNAFRTLAGISTSGQPLGKDTKVRPNVGGGIGRFLGQKEYNTADIIELNNKDGKLTFSFKKGVLGQQTDTTKIGLAQRLNSTTVLINDYIKAMSNVTEKNPTEIGDEVMLMMYELGVPLSEEYLDKVLDSRSK